MKRGDKFETPAIDYTGLKAAIIALASPVEGMRAVATDTHEQGVYDNGAWAWSALAGGGGGIPDAPSDNVYYGRRNAAWTNLKTYFDSVYQAIGTYLTSANIEDSIVDGHTTIAPSSNAVFDALAGKQPLLSTTALNDFQVGNGSGSWIKKTLAEVKAILGITGNFLFPFATYLNLNPITAGGAYPYAGTVLNRTISYISWTQALYLVSANSTSNYWTIELYKRTGASTDTKIATVTTKTATSIGTFVTTTTTFAEASVSGSFFLFLLCTPTGTPGNLYLFCPALEMNG